jgi:hypothetical protein
MIYRVAILGSVLLAGVGFTIPACAAGQFISVQTPESTKPADDIYRPRPGEAYTPATYCEWNRTGLPSEQQKICLDRDRNNPPKLYKAKPGEILVKLLPNCQIGGAASCNDDLYQPVWKEIEADNGEVTKIDMNSIKHLSGGTTDVTIYTGVPHTMFDQARLKMLWFDCQGHFMAFDGGMGQSPQLDAPPRSIAGRIAKIVCINQDAPNPAKHCAGSSSDACGPVKRAVNQSAPNPTEYCVGFSSEACERIKKVVETNVTPAFCKPGFGRVDSGLTPEQVRICSVMPPVGKN